MNAARFGAGFLVFGVLWMSGLGIVSAVLLPMHYKTIPGVNADALVGIVNAFTAVASLVANLMFGNFSDRSRSRFGRRTPWILFGAVLGGVTLFLTGTTHNAVLLTIFYCACMFGLNCMIAPMVAILSDRVPSKIRGTMSAFYGAGSTIGAPIGTMLGALFIENLIPGFAVAGVLMFLGGVVAVIIIPKEQSADFLPKDEGSAKDILSSFRPPKFSTAHDFYKAFAGRFCMLMAYQMINVYQLYIIQNYIGQSVKESAVTVSVVSMIMMVMSLVGSFISGPVSDLIGRRKVPVVVASVLFAVGIAMPWIFKSTMGMYLFAGIAGLGYAVYSAVDQALLVDFYDQYLGDVTYEDNLTSFGKVSLDAPYSISIYTDTFEAKEGVAACIENYNADRPEEEQITYTDYISLLTNSLTSMVNVVTYVLIAFVAVSLIVSCIMIGIITHISVMERTKEIGILRAIGASKRNISQVFNAETLIIGLCSGALGVGISVALTYPINAILKQLIESTSVTVYLPAQAGAVLVLISVVITMIGGMIPARKAAKKDPVIALRTE